MRGAGLCRPELVAAGEVSRVEVRGFADQILIVIMVGEFNLGSEKFVGKIGCVL